MKWFERICITWSLAAIAFNLGCAVRGEVDGQAVFHFVCVGVHTAIAGAYIAMAQRRWRGKQDESRN